jgi:hypothetical protein
MQNFLAYLEQRCFSLFPINNGKTLSVSSALQARNVILSLQLFTQLHESYLKFNVLFDESPENSSISSAL